MFMRMLRHAAAAGLGVLLASASASAQPAVAVSAVGVTVSDLDQAVDFYTRVLTFEPVSETEIAGPGHERLHGVFGLRARVAVLRLGDELLELTDYLAPASRPVPADSRSNDRWFQHVAIIVSDMDAAYARLREFGVEHASTGPQRLPDWNPNAGGIEAFYFKDPDGHVLEVLAFPEGKGDPKWRGGGDRLFLGIDHTAIVVADTDRSLAFYRDELGLRIAGTSENYGDEQEHLNHVFGARLRITTLKAPAGPGVELLEYLAPRDGRPYPADARASDLIHWNTVIAVTGIEGLATALLAGHATFVSPGAVLAEAADPAPSALVRDPDGHALRLEGATAP